MIINIIEIMIKELAQELAQVMELKLEPTNCIGIRKHNFIK